MFLPDFGLRVPASVSASVLSIYDKERYTGPMAGKSSSTWSELDQNVVSKLAEISAKGGKIRLVTNTVLSPSINSAIAHAMDIPS